MIAKNSVLATIGNKLKQGRTAMKLTQTELARKIGVEPAYYGQLERGRRSPSMQTLIVMANVLKLDLNYLFQNGKDGKKDESFSYETIKNMIIELPQKDQKFLVGIVRDAVRHLGKN